MTTAIEEMQVPDPKKASEWSRWRLAKRYNIRMYIASGIIAAYVLLAIFGPMITRFSPLDVNITGTLVPPLRRVPGHGTAVLGTDALGRDILAEVISGARISLVIGFVTVSIALIWGAVAGVIAGYVSGWADSVIMRLVDVQLAFPSVILAILIAGALGASAVNVIVALTLASWVVFARIARGITLATRSQPYVEASRLLGANTWHIMRRAILPSCSSSLVIFATVQLGFVIVAEAALSFLGVGIPPSQASWGSTIADGREYLQTAWWISTVPGLALAILVVCISTVGDELTSRRQG